MPQCDLHGPSEAVGNNSVLNKLSGLYMFTWFLCSP